jgi:predicted Zn-dependent protease
MRRRRFLGGCGVAGLGIAAGVPARADAGEWALPGRFVRPELASDEGGLWALMDREETRLRRSPLLMADASLRDYLQGIVCRLGGEHCADVRVYPVRTPWFNASMAPNGMVQIWSGLLLRVDNEAQLAAVIGHELAHYLQRHSIERLRDTRGRSAANLVFAMLGGVGLLAQLANMAGMAHYSREHESEADRIGLLLVQRAGYDPREAAKVWTQLRAELAAGAGGDPSRRSVLFASHPPSDEREKALTEAAAALPPGGELGRDALERVRAPHMSTLIADELQRGQYDETLVLLDRLLRDKPAQAELLYARGEARRLRGSPGDAEQATADLQACAALTDAPAAVHRSLGFVAQQRGDAALAKSSFERYIALSPDAADAALIRSYLGDLSVASPS